ncbi:MAG TPA: amidoligase family protein [Bdellovibrionota bacterium]|nr:amidoligase family protein [Bdellovibrionota bacterium]
MKLRPNAGKTVSWLLIASILLLPGAGDARVPLDLCYWREMLTRPGREATDAELRAALEHAMGRYEVRPSEPSGPSVGVEVEGLFPGWRSRADAAAVVKRSLETLYPGAQVTTRRILFEKNVVADGFKVSFEWQGQTYEWKLIDDPSIRGSSIGNPVSYLLSKRPFRGDTALEVVSPILRSTQDREAYLAVMAALRDEGFAEVPGRTGLHVHVGAEGASTAELVTLARAFGLTEPQLMEAFGVSERRMRHFSHPVGLAARDALLAFQDPSKLAWVLAKLRWTRNQALNFKSLERTKTVEFKLFNSTLAPGQLRSAIDFSIALVDGVRTKNPRLMEYFLNTPPERIELTQVARVLGVVLETPPGGQRAWTQLMLHRYHALQRTSAAAEFWRNDQHRVGVLVFALISELLLLGALTQFLPSGEPSDSPGSR